MSTSGNIGRVSAKPCIWQPPKVVAKAKFDAEVLITVGPLVNCMAIGLGAAVQGAPAGLMIITLLNEAGTVLPASGAGNGAKPFHCYAAVRPEPLPPDHVLPLVAQ